MPFRNSITICLFLFSAISLSCFFSSTSNAQLVHGQWVHRIIVAEHVEDVGAVAANPDKVWIGPAWFRRGNATRNTWRSYVRAYVPRVPFAPRPSFVYEKFPKDVDFGVESGVSREHPTKFLDKYRLGDVEFYFEPDAPFSFPPAIPLPTDRFDMAFGSAGPKVDFFRNLTSEMDPAPKRGFTTFAIQVRVDGPNNVSRADTVGDAHKYRVAFYSKQPDGTLVGPIAFDPFHNAVEYRTEVLSIPNEHAVVGKFTLIGRIEKNTHSFTGPDDPGHGWSGYVPFGENSGFKIQLSIDEGK